MKKFELGSGTTLTITEKFVEISRDEDSNSNLSGRAKGDVLIKLSSITGLIQYKNYMLICAEGFPFPKEFASHNIIGVKQLPNCLVGDIEILDSLYSELKQFI